MHPTTLRNAVEDLAILPFTEHQRLQSGSRTDSVPASYTAILRRIQEGEDLGPALDAYVDAARALAESATNVATQAERLRERVAFLAEVDHAHVVEIPPSGSEFVHTLTHPKAEGIDEALACGYPAAFSSWWKSYSLPPGTYALVGTSPSDWTIYNPTTGRAVPGMYR